MSILIKMSVVNLFDCQCAQIALKLGCICQYIFKIDINIPLIAVLKKYTNIKLSKYCQLIVKYIDFEKKIHIDNNSLIKDILI